MVALGFGVGVNAYGVASIDNRQAIEEAQAKLQGEQFEQFLSLFVEQGDFVCLVDTARSKTLGGPTPPPGLCTIKAP